MNAIVNFVTTIPIANIHPFEDNPYKVQDNEEMQFLCESIRENGVLSPLLVRKIGAAEEYEVISGHRRLYAAHKLGLTGLPTVITDLDRNAAAIALMDSNLHREHILPSEKAFAYKLKWKRCPIKVLLVDRLATSPAMRFPIPTAAARTGTSYGLSRTTISE